MLMQGLDNIRQAKKKREFFKIDDEQLAIKNDSDDEKSEPDEAQEPGVYDRFVDFKNQAKDKSMNDIKDLMK